ncbi:MAG: hypothetical protein ACPGXK_05570, partial [Phycisphaerae bacterium]
MATNIMKACIKSPSHCLRLSAGLSLLALASCTLGTSKEQQPSTRPYADSSKNAPQAPLPRAKHHALTDQQQRPRTLMSSAPNGMKGTTEPRVRRSTRSRQSQAAYDQSKSPHR